MSIKSGLTICGTHHSELKNEEFRQKYTFVRTQPGTSGQKLYGLQEDLHQTAAFVEESRLIFCDDIT